METTKTSQAGFSMVAVLIGTATFGTMIAFAMSQSNSEQNRIKNRRISSSKSFIINQIAQYSSMPASLRNSVSTTNPGLNPALAACIIGGVGSCVANTPTDFVLMSPVWSANPIAVGGISTSPVFYDQFGKACVSKSTVGCTVQVTTQFIADCGGSGTCSPANSIQVLYTIKGINGGALTGANGASAPVATTAVLATGVLPPPVQTSTPPTTSSQTSDATQPADTTQPAG